MFLEGFSIESLITLPITLVAFIALLCIIVFFHEYGHFSVARMLGVRVDVFSIGFGKTIARWRDRKGTEWRIAMLPLGGYVKFFGDEGPASNAGADVEAARRDDHPATTQFPRPGHEHEVGRGMSAEDRAVCFHFKPVWARSLIVAAGPVANFVLAVIIFAGLLMTFGQMVGERKSARFSLIPPPPPPASSRATLLERRTGGGRDFRPTMIVRLSSGEDIAF
ncbi:MAG: site-2 protease family protein [Parvularculaceae bacterium]